MTDPKPLPATDTPVLEHDELEWELFWHRHRTKILGGAVALVLAVGAFIAWTVSQSIASEASQQMLANATDSAGWEALIAKYPKSVAAADAYFQLASAQRDARKLDESTATFQKFLNVFPEHVLAGGALLGVGQNLDAAGKSEEAVTTYQQVVVKYPKSYAAPVAAYSAAEIQLRLLKRDEARRALEALVSDFPASYAGQLAQSQLQRLGSAPSAN